jgi:hypothetical protein
MAQFAQPADAPIKIQDLSNEFKQIYCEFIHLGSPNELNLPSKTRDGILQNFKEGRYICTLLLLCLE